MPDPVSRLEFARQEIDRVFGRGHAERNPEVVVAVMQTAASDWAASRLAVAIERVAVALLATSPSWLVTSRGGAARTGAGIVAADQRRSVVLP